MQIVGHTNGAALEEKNQLDWHFRADTILTILHS